MSIRVRLGRGFTYGRSGLRYNTRNFGIGRSGTRISAGPVNYWNPGYGQSKSASTQHRRKATPGGQSKLTTVVGILWVACLVLVQLFVWALIFACWMMVAIVVLLMACMGAPPRQRKYRY